MNEKEEFLNKFSDVYPEELVEKYELTECLSNREGNETLLATDRESGKKVVVKCYEKSNPCYDESEPKQIRELCFPGIPAYITEFSNDAMRCVVREYIEGESLASCGGKLTKRQVCKVGLELGEILKYLHSQNPPVIHRDIKPQNVIIQKDGSAALIDFGISRCYKNEQTSDTSLGGTHCFAPPEQYGFAQTDCRSDIYSLGILMSWLYTGSAAPVRNPSTSLERVLAKSTAFAPEKRFRNIDAFEHGIVMSLSAEEKWKRTAIAMTVVSAVMTAAFIAAAVLLVKKPAENPGFPVQGTGTAAVTGTAAGTDGSGLYSEVIRPVGIEPETGADALTGKISGSCGDNAVYVLDFDTDTLTISGGGSTWRFYHDDIWAFDVKDGIFDDPNYRNERPPWYKYRGEFDKVVVEQGITVLESYCFADCYRLKEAELKSVESIAMKCFFNCDLEKITMSDNLKSIGSWSFAWNERLEDIDMPESLESVGNSAFAGCLSLKKLVFRGGTRIDVLERNPHSVLSDDGGKHASQDAVLYCIEHSGVYIHAKDFGIPYVLIDER